MAFLSPVFNDEQLDNNGLPLVSGQVIFYLAGTSTVTTTYTDSSGTIAQTSPIVLNARGEPQNSIWLTPGQLYKARLFDSVGVLIREFDNIGGINDATFSGTSTTGTEWIGTITAVYVNPTTFSVVGDQTSLLAKYRRTKLTVSGGTCYGTITSSTYSLGITTIVQVNDSTPIDSGLSAFQYGLLSSTHQSYLPSIPSGSVMAFFQAGAPIGWTQNTTYTDNMLRVVSGVGGGSGGSDSPILMSKVPGHTHTFTSGTESATHTHNYTFPNTQVTSFGAGALNAVPSVAPGSSTGTESATHTHSGTTDNNAGSSNWTPKYLDMILCSKD